MPQINATRLQKRFRFLFAAILILFGIIVFSISAEKVSGILAQANILNQGFISVGAERRGAALSRTEGARIVFGSESEVFRFTLSATRDFTIRYIPFHFEHGGLDWIRFDSPEEWKIYEVATGEIVGAGAELLNGKLRIKMFQADKKDCGYILHSGVSTFSLVTTILDDKNSLPDFMKVNLENDDGWSFFQGAFSKSWGSLEGEKLGSEKVFGI